MAIRAKLGRGGETLDVASTLPPNKAIVMFDFAAQEPQDLALTRCEQCMECSGTAGSLKIPASG
jgi:hypothetical protein